MRMEWNGQVQNDLGEAEKIRKRTESRDLARFLVVDSIGRPLSFRFVFRRSHVCTLTPV